MTTRHALCLAALTLLLAAPAWSQGILFVEGDNVGIGTATPAVRLHIDNTGGDSNVVRLVRDGVLRYRLENSALGVAWDFNNDGNGNFAVSKLGTGKPELTINVLGDLGLGCGGADHDFVISPGPNCSATPRSWIDAGSTGFSTSSSRTIKENLQPLDASGLLEKIQDIPVYEYDFIDGPKERIGLMAEDFHTIFARGSNEELNGQEVTMALWLAVQELTAQVEELKAAQAETCNPSDGS